MKEIKGKVVLITGASSGIGLAAAYAFAQAGAKLMLCARREDKLIKACEDIRLKGGQANYKVADISIESQVIDLVQYTINTYGQIDILVNNAGYGHFLAFSQTTSADMRKIMDVNFFGTFYITQAVLPVMKKQGRGQIIMVSSVAAKRVFRRTGGAYNTSKYAMQSYAEALRLELLDTPIKVSIVCPVVTTTEFFDPVEKQTGKKAKLNGPIQSAEYVADAIVSLAKNPKAEIVMFKPARIILMLNALFPGLVDWIIYRFVDRQD